jgi:hypothetical protein
VTLAPYEELIPPRVVDPVRRRRWLVGVVVLALLASAVGGGVWWHRTANDRAQHRLQKALPAAEAAWPAVEAKIRALIPPTAWTADPTGTACAPLRGGVSCFRTEGPDARRALDTAVGLLTAQGARVGDPLFTLMVRGFGESDLPQSGCAPSPGVTLAQLPCWTYLTWNGASVKVSVVGGLVAYGVPAGVAIGRGDAYPEEQQAQMSTSSPSVGSNVEALRTLTGLSMAGLTGMACDRPARGGGCLQWRATFTTTQDPGEALRVDVRALSAHGFRVQSAGPVASTNAFGYAWRNREVGGGAPVLVTVRLHPDGHGGATGTVFIGTNGLPD